MGHARVKWSIAKRRQLIKDVAERHRRRGEPPWTEAHAVVWPPLPEAAEARRVKWTALEHALLVTGLREVGKNWAKLSKSFVGTKSPAQVAKYARIYHQRQQRKAEAKRKGKAKAKPPAETHEKRKGKRKRVDRDALGQADPKHAALEGCDDSALPRKRTGTDEEKSALLDGLNDLGWGEWAAIAKKYVPSKTSSQVCDYAHNHAKKYVPSKNWRLVSHCARREIAKGGTEGARRPANGRRESQEEEADFSEEDEMFFVEHILQRKMFEVQGKMVERCLVKWSGYSSEHNSWEPLENVAHILETHPAVDQATKE